MNITIIERVKCPWTKLLISNWKHEIQVRPVTTSNIKANDCILCTIQTSHTPVTAIKSRTDNLYFTARRAIKRSITEMSFHLPERLLLNQNNKSYEKQDRIKAL